MFISISEDDLFEGNDREKTGENFKKHQTRLVA